MSNSSTKDYNYKLTAAEKKLFEVLVNPEHTGKSVTELCNLAKISRNKYYQTMRKADFVELVNEVTMDLIKGKAADVLNATYKFAMKEKGHQDRKMLLTIADIYKDKQETKVTGDINVNNPFEGLSTEELRKLARSEKYEQDTT